MPADTSPSSAACGDCHFWWARLNPLNGAFSLLDSPAQLEEIVRDELVHSEQAERLLRDGTLTTCDLLDERVRCGVQRSRMCEFLCADCGDPI